MMKPLSATLAVLAILAGAPPIGDDRSPAPAREHSNSPPASPPSASAPAAAGSPADLLRGPGHSDGTRRRSIVDRTFEGRVRVIDDEPEVAALRLLLRDPAQVAALDSVVTRRIAAFDELVRSRVRELQQGVAALQRLEAAAGAGERLAAIGALSHAWQAFAPWRERGSAVDELGDRIDESTRNQARRLAAEYRAALVQERAADLGVPPSSPQALAAVRLEGFGRMVEQSFERQSRIGEQDFDRFVLALELTPEQAERARVIFGALYEKELARTATGWDRLRAISEFMRDLPPRQRALAWRFARAQGG